MKKFSYKILISILITLFVLPLYSISIKNNYIEIGCDDNSARIFVKTIKGLEDFNDDNKNLIKKGFLFLPEPSYTTIIVDGSAFKFGSFLGNWIKKPYIKNNSIIAIWEINEIAVKQVISITKGYISGEYDSLLIYYSAYNSSSTDKHKVSIRVMIDTALGFKAGSIVIPKKGIINNEAIIYRKDMPDYFYLLDNAENPTTMSYFQLKSDELFTPDKVLTASKFRLLFNKSMIEADTSKKILWNNAIAFYRNERELEPNTQLRLSFAFGLYKASVKTINDYTIILGSPAETEIKPFLVSMLVNKKESVKGLDCSIGFNKSDNFIIERREQKIESLSDKPEELSWDINPTKAAYGMNDFFVTIKSSIGDTITTGRGLHVTNKIITEAEIKSSYKTFSPNNDGRRDTISFFLTMKDDSGFNRVKFYITDDNDKEIWSIEKKGSKIETVEWDGKDKTGKIIGDGEYYYKLFVKNVQGTETYFTSPTYRFFLDTKAPEIDIYTDITNSLPPYDPGKTFITFFIKIASNDLDKWELSITDPTGSIIKKYSDTLPIDNIPWNGYTTGNKGLEINNTYTYSFKVFDKSGNLSIKNGEINIIDKEKPSGEISLSVSEISQPSSQTQKPIEFFIKASDNYKIKSWNIQILDKENNIVKEIKGEKEPKEKISWNGFTDNGKPLEINKTYSVIFQVEDYSKNVFEKQIDNALFIKDTIPPKCDISAQPTKLLPSEHIEIVFSMVASDNYKLKNWEVLIFENPLESLDEKAGILFKKFSGQGSPPDEIKWDGLSDNNKPISIAKLYTYSLKVLDLFDNTAVDDKPSNRISTEDKIIPEAMASVKIADSDKNPNILFSPDGDGLADTAEFTLSASDNYKIKSWKLHIVDRQDREFKTYEGIGNPPEHIIWDGKGNDGYLVGNGDLYNYFLEVEDMAGNKGFSTRNQIEIDILLIKIDRGFKMSFNNITFAFNSATLDKDAFYILEKVNKVLARYDDRKILVEGYTDSIGSAAYNKKLSLKRAESIVKYLVDNNIVKASNIIAKGLGKTNPVASNKTESGRAQNRRVEIIILKKDVKDN